MFSKVSSLYVFIYLFIYIYILYYILYIHIPGFHGKNPMFSLWSHHPKEFFGLQAPSPPEMPPTLKPKEAQARDGGTNIRHHLGLKMLKHVETLSINGLVKGKICRKPWGFPWNMRLSCKLSLQPNPLNQRMESTGTEFPTIHSLFLLSLRKSDDGNRWN